MVTCRRGKQEKFMDFDDWEECLKEVYHTKYYHGSVKNSTFSFSSDLQIDKKFIQGEKLIQTLIFSKRCAVKRLWGFNKKKCYVVHIIELILHQKKMK